MKHNLTNFLLIGILSMTLFSCASNSMISNGAYSDVSLNQGSDQFEIKRLKEVKSEGSAVFGIPYDTKVGNKTGMIVRFNGVNLTGTKRILPVLTLVGLSIAGGSVINEAVGYKNDSFFQPEYKLGLALSSVIALPVSGMINNQIWGDAAVGRASQKLNRELVEKNPEVDVFLNPKYVINKNNSLWTQKATISVKTMGATLKVD